MRYGEVLPAEFIARPNRFIAHVRLRGEEVVCHVKNTGRCRELLQSGVQVWLEEGTNPRRKTAYDLIAVQKGERLVNMDAQAPNRTFGEWATYLEPGVLSVKSEVFFEDSRLDFLLETETGVSLRGGKGRHLGKRRPCTFSRCAHGARCTAFTYADERCGAGASSHGVFRSADGQCSGLCTQR